MRRLERSRRNIYDRVIIQLRSQFQTEIPSFSACSDDGQLLAWNVLHNEFVKVTQLNEDVLPTDLQFLSKSSSSLGKHSDVLLITSANGRFYIANRNGRVERTVEAHKGAILVGQWSNDGVGLMTGPHLELNEFTFERPPNF